MMVATTYARISDQLGDVYSICWSGWNVATYKWNVHNGKIEILSFVLMFVLYRPSLSMSGCMSRIESDLAVTVISFISTSMG